MDARTLACHLMETLAGVIRTPCRGTSWRLPPVSGQLEDYFTGYDLLERAARSGGFLISAVSRLRAVAKSCWTSSGAESWGALPWSCRNRFEDLPGFRRHSRSPGGRCNIKGN